MTVMDGTLLPPPNDDRGKGLMAEEVTLTTIALLTTIVRVGMRLYNRQAKWDDLAITIAMVFRLLSFSFTMVTISYGNGRHQAYLTQHQVQEILKYTWANEVLIFTTVCIVKIAICLHIFRIQNRRWLKWMLNLSMVGLVITNGACIIILFAQCQPLRAYWDPSAGHCWNGNIYNDFIYVSVSYSIVTDLMCTAMPIIILWNVQITMRQKVAICGLMFLGLVASACAAVRAYLSSLAQGTDLSYTLVSTDEWGFAEANVGIIGANLALGQMMYVFWNKHIRNSQRMERLRSGASWRPWIHKHKSDTTLCEPNASQQSKEEDHHSTNGSTTPVHDRSSYVSTWPTERNSNFSGTIMRTIEYTVADMPEEEVRAHRQSPMGSPVLGFNRGSTMSQSCVSSSW